MLSISRAFRTVLKTSSSSCVLVILTQKVNYFSLKMLFNVMALGKNLLTLFTKDKTTRNLCTFKKDFSLLHYW